METLTIVNGDIYTPAHYGPGNIVIHGDTISTITKEQLPPSEGVIDAAGCLVLPGLIDGLIHGGGGYDSMTGKVEDIETIARAHAVNGVTSLVVGISSGSMEQINASLEAIAQVVDQPIADGARIIGSYVEGKFGSLAKNGAQNAKYITPPNFEEFHAMWAASDGTLKVISVAPENDENLQFIKHLAEYKADAYNDIIIAMGHTNATYQQAMDAIDAGVTRATHTYNGMSGMHHRDLGALEAVFAHPNVHAELIVDEHHVNPFWGKHLIQYKGISGVGLITDCTEHAGLSAEEWQKDAVYEAEHNAYRLNGTTHEDTHTPKYIKNGAMWLDVGKPTERLAGAIITLMDGVRNVIAWGFSLEDALTMATLTPAQNFGVDDHVGSIAPDKAADIVIVDENLNVQNVILRGKVIKL
ncbi:N-acetylglucosamine-6-phosphate deacetylase [Candidatus Poribacteria bacterium]|nr:MAG: N-acetylglucosamine-6-phosphate deacetylase [Candidatus Poribacteria bacterium]